MKRGDTFYGNTGGVGVIVWVKDGRVRYAFANEDYPWACLVEDIKDFKKWTCLAPRMLSPTRRELLAEAKRELSAVRKAVEALEKT